MHEDGKHLGRDGRLGVRKVDQPDFLLVLSRECGNDPY